MFEVLLVLGAAALLGSGTFIGYRLGRGKSSPVSISSPALLLPSPEEIAALPEAGGEGPYRRRGECTAIVPATNESWLQRWRQRREFRAFNQGVMAEISKIQHIETEKIKIYREQQIERIDINYLINVLFGFIDGDHWLAKEVIRKRKNIGDREALLTALAQPRPRAENFRIVWTDLQPHVSAISDIISCASTRGFFDITFVQTVAGISRHDFAWSNYMDEASKQFPEAYRWYGLDCV
ncbi:hypothetical protein KKF05_01445 [Patescibacteria group bacterium]|nr:hypothetical protein [Patescibacteria group bacterium]